MRLRTVFAGGILTMLSTVLFPAQAEAAIPASERAALIALWNSTRGAFWSHKWTWSSGGFGAPGTECTWFGVTCSADGETIEVLDLSQNLLKGTIPPELGNLTNLKGLYLDENSLGDSVPAELGNLANLEELHLGTFLDGGLRSIPPELGNLASLRELLLQNNQLTSVPAELGNLTTLEFLDLSSNQLTAIPPELGNLVNLIVLRLQDNQLTGPIPPELGNLNRLVLLDLHSNQLTAIPPELGNLADLIDLLLQNNQLTGPIPPELGNLTRLVTLNLHSNQLRGAIPPQLGNLVRLVTLDLENNQLTGAIPPELSKLFFLQSLLLRNNQLTGAILPELGLFMANLVTLDLGSNQLTGGVPPELGNLIFGLQFIFLDNNLLTGSIPAELGNVSALRELDLSNNQLTGTIPSEFANLDQLTSLDLGSNQLTGALPAVLGDMLPLEFLTLANNQFTGPILPELANLKFLQDLDLSNNQLTGTIPELADLSRLNLSSNQLTGSIPPGLGNLDQLTFLDLGSNQLTGPIPPELGDLDNLRFLSLADNQLTGPIPDHLMQLSNLEFSFGLDLRGNHLFTDNNVLRQFIHTRQIGVLWERSQTLQRFFAHFGDGGGLSSQLVLFSLHDGFSDSAQVQILGASGEGLEVDLNGEIVNGTQNVTVPRTGVTSLKTDGQGIVQAGSVRVATSFHVEGVVIFGGDFGRAGVGSSAESSSDFVAPMQRNEALGINTGIAVTVLGEEEAALDLTLRDREGNALGVSFETVAGQGHKAFFLTDFNWGGAVDFSDFVGTLWVNSSQPVIGTVLQTRPSEMVTLPVIALQGSLEPGSQEGLQAVASQELSFAQFADGLGLLSSQILLFNPSDDTWAAVQITIRDSAGELLAVDLNGQEIGGETQLEIGPRSLKVLATDGLGDLKVGSVVVTSDQPVAGVIIFAGEFVGAAGVGDSQELQEGFVAPMETNLAADINTGIAVMNLEEEDATLAVDLLGSNGILLATSQLLIPARGHTSLFVSEFAWNKAVDFSEFRGLLKVKSAGRKAATVIQTHPGQFATLPVAPKPL